MPRYVIERDLPGAGNLGPEELRAVSQKSRDVLREMTPDINWEHSYVTGDKIYCVYNAPTEDLIREHAKKGEFPITKIMQVSAVIDPMTAE